MNQQDNEAGGAGSPEYEAPRIESVVTREDMEREVHYAGAPATN
jgi:hypothetical protein